MAFDGVKLVLSDAHEGIKAAVSKVCAATWQRCRVHFMRNAMAHAGKSGRRVVSAFIATGAPMAVRCHGVGHRGPHGIAQTDDDAAASLTDMTG